MAFTQETFAPVNSGSTVAPSFWSYRTQDLTAEVISPGYFLDKQFQIELGDFIYVTASDSTALVKYNGFDQNQTQLNGMPVTVLQAFSTATQEPGPSPGGDLDSPQRVEFGAAQGTGSDPLQIDATGLITINQAGSYNFRAIFSVERSGGTGEAFIFFRVLINGQPAGNPVVFQLDVQEITLPPQFDFFDTLKVGDTIEVEFYRDSQGTPAANEGSLVSYTSQIGWGATPSASLSVTKFG